MEQIKLTKTVQKGGCAAKVAASELKTLLARVKFPTKTDNILVDGSQFDDAAIIQFDDKTSLVQTLDFFTPIVDTPKTFGRIAAANALSDVYAMGGKPISAMAILAYPIATLSQEIISEVIQGACDVLEEAGTPLVGGHSIDDDTLKFGLSVTGTVETNKVWTNANAKVGDVLILTKPLGTGAATAGLKREAWGEAQMQDVLNSMGTINSILDLLGDSLALSIHAATDVTGFGLAGHAMQMAKASQKSFEFSFSKLPIFEISKVALAEGFLTKAHRTNAEYTNDNIDWQIDSQNVLSKIFFDPQTSGGLLLSVDAAKANDVKQRLQLRFPATSIIGEVKSNALKQLVFKA